jgi:hypothetical protein
VSQPLPFISIGQRFFGGGCYYRSSVLLGHLMATAIQNDV